MDTNINKKIRAISLKQLEQQLKQNYVNESNKYIFDNYNYHLTRYFKYHNLEAVVYFNYPFKYFIVQQNKLTFTWDKTIDFERDLKSAFDTLNLPCSADCFFEMELIDALKKLLTKTTKLQHSLNEYTLKTGKNFPINSFFFYEGNLYYFTDQALQPFTADTYKHWNHYFPMFPRPNRTIIKELVKYATILDKQYTLEHTPFLIIKKKSKNVYFQIKPENNSLSVIAENQLPWKQELCNTIGTNNLKLDISNISNPFSEFTNDMASFLFYLTGGNLQTLQNLCMLIYELYTQDGQNDLFVVHGTLNSTNSSDLFKKFLNLLGVYDYIKCFNSLNTFVTLNNIKQISNDTFTSVRGYYIDNPGCLKHKAKHDLFKRIITGKHIRLNDAITKQIKVKNRLPVICYVNSHQELIYLNNNYKFRCIDLTTSEFSMLYDILEHNLSESFIIALTYYIYILGMHFSNCSNKSSKKRVYSVPHDQILNDFSKLCLVKRPQTDFIYADELYEAYCYYFENNYTTEPLKRCQMVNKFKILGTYLYKRPHASRNAHNKYAFCGMSLKRNWKKLIDESKKPLHSFEKENFENNLTDLISKLPEFPMDAFSHILNMKFSRLESR